MTHLCTTDPQEIAQLDYGKPPPGYEVGNDADEEDRLITIVSGRGLDSQRLGRRTPWAWNDPSGFGLESCGDAETRPEALAAAWAHYKAHNDPPGLDVERFGFGQRDAEQPWWMTTSETEERPAAWTWHDRRHTPAEKLDTGTFCPECHSQDAYSEVIDAETSTQPWCTECDVEMGGLFDDDLWPRLLAASDDQIAEVERWLLDSTAEMPEVLRG